MFKLCTIAAAFVAVGLFSSSAFAMGGDGGAWKRTQHTTTGVCVPVFDACPGAPAKHHVAKHKVPKTVSAAKSCVFTVDNPFNPYTGKLTFTAANVGGC